MQFIVVMSPTIKLLVLKYQGKIAIQGVESDIFSKIKASKLLLPSDLKDYVQVLTSIRKHLVDNNIQLHREAVKKLVGDGMTWKGLLNLMMERGDVVYICPYEPGSMLQSFTAMNLKEIMNLSSTRVLMPLNLDENEELYSFFQQELKVPVYPMLCNFSTSKWLKNVLFAPYAPRAFYFPEGTNAQDLIGKVLEIATQQNITHFILKDEYDFDIRPMIPYLVVPTNKIDLACRIFYENVRGIPNYGGLVLEEFMSTNNSINIVSTHVFRRAIRSMHVIETIRLKPIGDGGPFDTFIIDVKKQVVNDVPVKMDAIDAVVGKHYPYLLSTIEFIIHDGTPKVIDINSVSNSLRFETIMPGLNPDVIFKQLLSQVSELNNDIELPRQIAYHDKIKSVYKNVQLFGPAFFDRGKLVSLIDGESKNVLDFLE